MAQPNGRPTKYHDQFPQLVINYFEEHYNEMKRRGEDKLPPFPSVAGFCAENKICKDTFARWVNKYPDFSDAARRGKAIQEQILALGTLYGHYNASSAKLFAASNLGYSEQTKQEITHKAPVNVEFTSADRAIASSTEVPKIEE